jgi:hypothetical protein
MDFYLIFLGIENIWLKRIIHLDFIYIYLDRDHLFLTKSGRFRLFGIEVMNPIVNNRILSKQSKNVEKNNPHFNCK